MSFLCNVTVKHALRPSGGLANFGCVSAELFGVLLLSLALAGAQALTPSHHLSLSDVGRLQNLLNQPYNDLESAYYSVVGLTKLGAAVADPTVRYSPLLLLSKNY